MSTLYARGWVWNKTRQLWYLRTPALSNTGLAGTGNTNAATGSTAGAPSATGAAAVAAALGDRAETHVLSWDLNTWQQVAVPRAQVAADADAATKEELMAEEPEPAAATVLTVAADGN